MSMPNRYSAFEPTLMRTLSLRLFLAVGLSCLVPLLSRGQSAATGAITGRVFNAATKEYVRNAEVRVDGTNIVAYTEDAGVYRLAGVPAGQANISVTYSGAEPVRATLTIAPGQAATRDFELSSKSAGESVVTLGAFV